MQLILQQNRATDVNVYINVKEYPSGLSNFLKIPVHLHFESR